MMKPVLPLVLLLLTFLSLSRCVRYKDLVNFRENPIDINQFDSLSNGAILKIQPNDLLQITISAGDSEAAKLAAAPFNQPTTGNQQGGIFQQQNQLGGSTASFPFEYFNGYFVDANGDVNLPTLGALHIGGMTLVEAHQYIKKLLEPFLEQPGVDVRFLNLKVTLFGEIARPGLLRLSNQRTTILEAISASGDLTPFADRRKVTVVREVDGQRNYYRIDLTRKEVFTSPAYYLRQNDLIYIEPLPIKIASAPDLISRIISYTTAGLSLVTLIIALGR
ncbi:MAG: polysaccharide biosynthesis/export family protein [Saprospiraceae bacterium]|jgi:polysaccharide export outer membrane protein|nr:polysaccharide biosynthesis/export family protein [Saprospiraceae bacterium]